MTLVWMFDTCYHRCKTFLPFVTCRDHGHTPAADSGEFPDQSPAIGRLMRTRLRSLPCLDDGRPYFYFSFRLLGGVVVVVCPEVVKVGVWLLCPYACLAIFRVVQGTDCGNRKSAAAHTHTYAHPTGGEARATQVSLSSLYYSILQKAVTATPPLGQSQNHERNRQHQHHKHGVGLPLPAFSAPATMLRYARELEKKGEQLTNPKLVLGIENACLSSGPRTNKNTET